MDLVDEKHFVALQVGQDAGQIGGFFHHGAAADGDVHIQFARDDGSQGCFAEAGRAKEEHMVERLLAQFGGADGNVQKLFDVLLADEFVQGARPQRAVEFRVLGVFQRRVDAFEHYFSIPKIFIACSLQTIQAASQTMWRLILDTPLRRSVNTIGISWTRKPLTQARKFISIWKA